MCTNSTGIWSIVAVGLFAWVTDHDSHDENLCGEQCNDTTIQAAHENTFKSKFIFLIFLTLQFAAYFFFSGRHFGDVMTQRKLPVVS